MNLFDILLKTEHTSLETTSFAMQDLNFLQHHRIYLNDL